jgi:hypothetical protein
MSPIENLLMDLFAFVCHKYTTHLEQSRIAFDVLPKDGCVMMNGNRFFQLLAEICLLFEQGVEHILAWFVSLMEQALIPVV